MNLPFKQVTLFIWADLSNGVQIEKNLSRAMMGKAINCGSNIIKLILQKLR